MNELAKRRELANESMKHNLERMGIILISVCSGGVYVCMESIKFSKEQHMEKPTLIVISGILFVVAILFSFFSHYLSYLVHRKDYEAVLLYQKDNPDPNELKSLEKQCKTYNKRIVFFNTSSILAMGMGLLALIIYFSFLL
ncbi:MAG: hypothetical protein AB3N18_11920 [Allomuricauda sp.]